MSDFDWADLEIKEKMRLRNITTRADIAKEHNRRVKEKEKIERQNRTIKMIENFVKGIRLETKKNQYGGEYIKASINVEQIFENPVNNEKWVNFMIFKSKNGNWYTQLAKKQEEIKDTQIKSFD